MTMTASALSDTATESSKRYFCWSSFRPRIIALALLATTPAYAQGSPWEQAVTVLQAAFTGPIAKGLSLVAIVVGGLMFAFGEGESKRMLAGIIFGVGMAIGAAAFMSWLFGG
jgi:type IV secretory pathway VirB2 component (pilin)